MSKLTDKQRAFIHEYMIDKNATQAAIRAGYSKSTARMIGSENLAKPAIKAEIDKLLNKLNEKAGLTAELVLSSIVRELKFDPAALYDEAGNLKPIQDIDLESRMVLTGVEAIQMGGEDSSAIIRKVKWNPPSQAREQAMKHLGMFGEDNKQQRIVVRVKNFTGEPTQGGDDDSDD